MYRTRSTPCWKRASVGTQCSEPRGGSACCDQVRQDSRLDSPYHRGEQGCSRFPFPSLPVYSVRVVPREKYIERTLNAASTVPCTIFVHVKCRIVSAPYSSCVSPAKSRVQSFVVPPAPQVILTANGFKATIRAMRDTRFSKPCKKSTQSVRTPS